jgi:hypothetical protein
MADEGKRGPSNRKCYGQGTGDVFALLIGDYGGCVLWGQSIVNKQKLGFIVGVLLLANAPVASLVVAVLLGCCSSFPWSSLPLINKSRVWML